jgi:hypothetical protein
MRAPPPLKPPPARAPPPPWPPRASAELVKAAAARMAAQKIDAVFNMTRLLSEMIFDSRRPCSAGMLT